MLLFYVFLSSGLIDQITCTGLFIYVLFLYLLCSHKIEVAYQEAVALKRQEELIREEEAAWLAESEQKAKRGGTEKEKKSKKKQV